MKRKIISANIREKRKRSLYRKVFLGLGTNLGNRGKNLSTAIEELKKISKITKKSSIYETEPIGYKDQGIFLNMVVKIETKLSPKELLAKLHEIEHKMGRNREKEIKNGPRSIDIDILLYKGKILNEQNLQIPHPRMHIRKFVLQPLAEIASKVKHPILNKNIETILNEYKKS